MSSLSNKEKEQLQNAVERITDYCVDGMSPNNAIIKTAKEMRLTPDRLPVLVNAYNAGATAEHWNSYDSVREKTASFPIADLDVIRKTLYPQTVKKASKNRIESRDEDFSLSPDLMFGENLLDCYKGHLPVLQKSASYSTREKLKTNIETHDAMRAAEKQSSEDVAMAMMDAEACLTKLAKVVNYHGMPDFASLKKTTEMVYGQDGLNVMTYLEETYPQRKGMSKKAVALQGNHPFYTLMTEAIALTKKVAAAQKKEQEVKTKCAAMKSEMDERWRSVIHGDPIHRLLLTPAGINKAAAENEKKNLTKQALREEYDIPHHTTLLDQLNHPEWNGATEREYGILNALADPNHDAKLRNIQTETMFTDLINTDEFLSKQDPEAVLEAYNDLLEVAPNLRGKKMLMRQALREYLASESLDMSTIAQLQKMDATEQSKYDAKRKERIDSVQRFAESEQKQRQEDAKLEQKERQLRQEVEQKELDRKHQLELEKRRIDSSEAESARNRRSNEGIERLKLTQSAREGARERQARHAEGVLERQSRHDEGVLDRRFRRDMASADAQQAARQEAQRRADALSKERRDYGKWLMEHGKEVLDTGYSLEDQLNNMYRTLITDQKDKHGRTIRRGLPPAEAERIIDQRVQALNELGLGLYRSGKTQVTNRSRPVYERTNNQAKDKHGNPIFDAAGKPVMEIKRDSGGKPVYKKDSLNRTLYETMPRWSITPNKDVFPQGATGNMSVPQLFNFEGIQPAQPARPAQRRSILHPFRRTTPATPATPAFLPPSDMHELTAANPVLSPAAGMDVPGNANPYNNIQID